MRFQRLHDLYTNNSPQCYLDNQVPLVKEQDPNGLQHLKMRELQAYDLRCLKIRDDQWQPLLHCKHRTLPTELLAINSGHVDNQDCQVPVKEIPTANTKANHFEKKLIQPANSPCVINACSTWVNLGYQLVFT